MGAALVGALAAWAGSVRADDGDDDDDKRAIPQGSEVLAVAFSPDGKTLAAAGEFGLKLWDPVTKKLKRAWPGPDSPEQVSSVAFSHDGKRLFIAGYRVHVMDLATFAVRDQPGEDVRPCVTIAPSPDDKWLACGLKDFSPVKIDADKLSIVARLADPEHEITSRSMALSPDGRKIVFDKAGDEALHVLDTATWKESGTITAGISRGALAFSPNGKLLAIGNSSAGGATLVVWDMQTGKSIGDIADTDGVADVRGLAFTPDSQGLATADRYTHSSRLYDLVRKKLKGELATQHRPSPNCVAVSPDGKLFASGGEDNTVRIRDKATPIVPLQ